MPKPEVIRLPIYGYRCSKCENYFEIFTNINDHSQKICPKCGGETTKLFYPAGIIFKGSGFYATDYVKKETANKDSSQKEKDKRRTKEKVEKVKEK
jgi:putative FmdB family regulatory protein